MLITLSSAAISQTIGHNRPVFKHDSLVLSPIQVDNVWRGVKLSEGYRVQRDSCVVDVKRLQLLIQDQNTEIKQYARDEIGYVKQVSALYAELADKKVEVVKLENKKIPWYRHPITYIIVGFTAGVWVAK